MKPLTYQDLADTYLQLGQLYKAGLPHEDALKQLSKLKTPAAERARRTMMFLKRGNPLPASGAKAGLFAPADIALLEAADMSGNYTEIYQSLATMYSDSARHQRQIRGRLGLPFFMLVLAIFVPPLPALVRGDLPLNEYFTTGFGFMLLLAAVLLAMLYLPELLKRNGAARPIDMLALILPYFGPWNLRRQLCRFMQVLALLMRCGVPILEALPKACDAVENTVLRARLQFLKPAIEDGESLADALREVRGVNQQALSMAQVGEHSGTLDSMLQYYVNQETEDLAQRNAAFAAWLPRLVYGAVAVFIAYSILRGGVMAPL